ncbi:U2 small nuclear ribonucleoprotein auxiliary factor 35 kDa subunit-related protein 2 isoform X1 [Bacillus rossius redtenbacheri]|uniref:U2 small nuclear ribonucleoprotein auxiliary factor 35 kDa subunit-related protein 2 isoform X1 n=1 Tax=Bacillus rossius redtenbacheri TaxID=93214 RepID=UPI002FDD861C
MGRHKEWRAVAKKMMRKAKRQKIAQARDALLSEERQARERSPRYQAWLCEQEALEQFEREEGARLQRERHAQWERDEELAQQAWAERQEKMTKARQERATQEQKIREIWEEEQKKLKEAEDEKNKKKEEKQQAQEELMKHIDDFINNGKQLPPSLTLTKETNPDKPVCPFFSKTGACRFGDRCSRNHPRPAISKVLLIANFYSHFVLNQFETDEYDTDVMLEYEDSERYQHFKEFYNDVLPEFEHHGRVVQFKVCRNFEPHLRGNVYVEYMKTRDAVTAFQKFQGRWYGGRQLSIEFTAVTSWKSAICGSLPQRQGLQLPPRVPQPRECVRQRGQRLPAALVAAQALVVQVALAQQPALGLSRPPGQEAQEPRERQGGALVRVPGAGRPARQRGRRETTQQGAQLQPPQAQTEALFGRRPVAQRQEPLPLALAQEGEAAALAIPLPLQVVCDCCE